MEERARHADSYAYPCASILLGRLVGEYDEVSRTTSPEPPALTPPGKKGTGTCQLS